MWRPAGDEPVAPNDATARPDAAFARQPGGEVCPSARDADGAWESGRCRGVARLREDPPDALAGTGSAGRRRTEAECGPGGTSAATPLPFGHGALL